MKSGDFTEKLLEHEQIRHRGRIAELDFLKGIALILMILNHIFFDLSQFFSADVSRFDLFASIVGKLSAVMFMTLCGVSATLGKRNVQNGLRLLFLATALSLATAVFDRVSGTEVCIKFGILHFLSFAMMLSCAVKKLPVWATGILALASYAIGKYFSTVFVDAWFLFPLGLRTRQFSSGDYYPLFPNLCFVFLGIIIGKTLYKNRKSLFKRQPGLIKPLCFLGRHTLILYFVHQPIILAVLYVVMKIVKQ